MEASRTVGQEDARVVSRFARNLQVHERLTAQVTGWLDTIATGAAAPSVASSKEEIL